MKKITDIKALFSNKELLAAHQAADVKGGVAAAIANSAAINNPNSAVYAATNAVAATPADDKRRPRPGGGASTQLFPSN
jgi:hypothetical protein